ncbi:MAG: AAA family ATPase [Proteobacteria bacterium]|nr:AAA family ATPase [Pseudomonadota bacterium]
MYKIQGCFINHAKMYRKKLENLKHWSQQSNRKPLIIRGARQVGKSTIVRMFAAIVGYDLLEINFERNPEHVRIFNSNNPKEIIDLLEVSFNFDISKNTLLFLDEIQAEPQVLKCLRYFYEEAQFLPIICAGSLLDFELNSPTFSVPVGRISYMYLHPMGFVEFLLASGNNKLAQFIESFNARDIIPNVIHQKLLNEFKIFTLVGGMPEAVKIFAQTKSYNKTEAVKQDLLATFQDDFAKYSKHQQYNLIRKIFSQVSQNIGKKIKYANLSRENKALDVANVIDLLTGARVIKKVVRSSANGVPLSAEANYKFFKIIFLDIGLISTQLNITALTLNSEKLMMINHGVLAEQWIGQALLLNTDNNQLPELHYWAREKKSSSAEIDYVTSSANEVIPIEVKAGKTGTLKSLHLFMQEKNSKLAIRFNTDISSYYPQEKILSLPLYLAERLQTLISTMIQK